MSSALRSPALHTVGRHTTWAIVALVAAALLVLGVPPRSVRAAPPDGWEYLTVTWTEEDTAAILRRVTGATELADPLELAQALERQGPLLDNPRVQAAVDERLLEKLRAEGTRGYELCWMREQTALAGGAPFRMATLYLKRPRGG